MSEPSLPRLLNTDQVSEMTGIPPSTLRYWRSTKTGGPLSFKLGGRVKYREEDVLAWINEHISKGTTQEDHE